MMNFRKICPKICLKIYLLCILDIIFISGMSHAAEDKMEFGHSELSILSAGHRHKLDVEVATTFEQHARGLMFRKEMADRHGMLFLFHDSLMITMWMKNTYIPLDIVFIDRRGVIVHIARNAVPLSLEYISSVKPVIYVLELNGGITDRLGIKVGDRVLSPSFTVRP